jgi:hypothetical protein
MSAWLQNLYALGPLLHYDTDELRATVEKRGGVWSWHLEKRMGIPGGHIIERGRGRYTRLASAKAAALAALERYVCDEQVTR